LNITVSAVIVKNFIQIFICKKYTTEIVNIRIQVLHIKQFSPIPPKYKILPKNITTYTQRVKVKKLRYIQVIFLVQIHNN
jgi:hypothetical protein